MTGFLTPSFRLATIMLLLVLNSHAALQLEWSEPVLVAGPTADVPAGPDVPDSFFAFNSDHLAGPAYPHADSWSFSADAGRSWSVGGPPVPHPTSPKILVGPGHYRSLGGGTTFTTTSWNLTWPRDYELTPDGTNFTIRPAPGGYGPNHTVRFTGVPPPGVNITHPTIKPGSRNYGLVRMANNHFLLTTCILWNGLQPRPGPPHETEFTPFSVVAFTSADGYDWQYSATIANWDSAGTPTYWGPNENDVALLSDNRTLVCVLRMDGDSSCATESYKDYYAAYSSDNGLSWSAPRRIDGAGCARPRLLKLASGPLLLSGGRLCVENASGVFAWVNEDGMGGIGGGAPRAEWVKHSISYQHNRLWRGDPIYLFDERVNVSDAWQTLSYTTMMATGPDSLTITYQRFFPYGPNCSVKSWPGPNVNFAIQVRVLRT